MVSYILSTPFKIAMISVLCMRKLVIEFKLKTCSPTACVLFMMQILQANLLVPPKAGSVGPHYMICLYLQGDKTFSCSILSCLLLHHSANGSFPLSFPYRWASLLWAMETCTQRPSWAGFLPFSALLLELSSTGCQFPSSTTNSQITTASSKLMNILLWEGKGER